MHDDMARINALIAKNEGLSKRLASAVYMTERVFSEELREMEAESAAADARVEALRGEKERLLADLVECERQVALWEKKIELEREMQAALDPRVGESEIAAMEKEIHRMRLRQDALQREQERLVAEMHRAIDKREVIHTKHKSAKAVTLLAAAAGADGSRRGSAASSSPATPAGGVPAATVTLKGGGAHMGTRAGMHVRRGASGCGRPRSCLGTVTRMSLTPCPPAAATGSRAAPGNRHKARPGFRARGSPGDAGAGGGRGGGGGGRARRRCRCARGTGGGPPVGDKCQPLREAEGR